MRASRQSVSTSPRRGEAWSEYQVSSWMMHTSLYVSRFLCIFLLMEEAHNWLNLLFRRKVHRPEPAAERHLRWTGFLAIWILIPQNSDDARLTRQQPGHYSLHRSSASLPAGPPGLVAATTAL